VGWIRFAGEYSLKIGALLNMLNEGVTVPMLSSDQEAAVGTTEAGTLLLHKLSLVI
jgi:hypothetical protein